ncbi:blue copper protein-like [Argentina anserina]|uniref:blue copper protein-like n=1 Tax=Argentina anserina TaxID=57926 RepID=UPI0021766DBB|nr:blue copper protein-like [Potentilla anserina]
MTIRNSTRAVFAALVAALAVSSVSAVTHQVGDGLGWNVPPGGAVAYSTWASNNTFKAGDTLVFTFTSGAHDVAEVTKEAFDACNATSPISLTTDSPASLTLTSGEHYYICTFGGHCGSGQKLAVNVTGTTSSPSPAPSMSTPPPAASPAPVLAPEPSSSASPPAPATSAPAPSPSVGPTTFIVGDVPGWNVLGNGTYTIWASNKTFLVGDVLVFNFLNNSHDVAEVTKTNYESCGTSNPLSLYKNPPVRITLNTTGEHFFICTYADHCNNGQKLAINVSSSTATPTSSPAPSPGGSAPTPSTTATPPSGTTTPSTSGPASDVTPPPSANGATTLGVAGLSSATFLSIAVALFLF